ncbi:MAG: tripartite tricarboxylate transporter permease [Gracilibacteraceae bacterium]|jgi:putative tricarboxylic transport membrane protein|nr:tripartite tricarboxylate transporter permease [Gracilibacteraceae bacterium]
MLEQLGQALTIAITAENFLFMAIGTVLGIVFAAIPGLTFSTALILFLPMTFGISPIAAISVMLGIFCGGMTGGSISAVLLGIPGTPSAAATVIDGFVLAKKGQGGKALGTAVYASVFGGIVSVLIMICVAPLIAKVALTFGPAELFMLVLFGLSTVVGLSEGNMLKALIACLMGLLFTTVGMDPVVGLQRFTFHFAPLMSGIGIMPVMIGAFAFPEIINTFLEYKKDKGYKEKKIESSVKAAFPDNKEKKRLLPLNIEASLMGTVIGAIPGGGGPVAAFLGYSLAKSKNPRCGSGELEGIAGPETANNAVTGGAMITLLTLGIPADSAAAIILGVFLIHGVVPGPMLFQDNGPMIYALFISMLIINVMVLVFQFFGMKVFVKVLNLPKINLLAVILSVTVVGAYATHVSFTDITIMFIIGLLAWFMKRHQFPVIPLILGLVLGGEIERNLRIALLLSGGSLNFFMHSVVSVLFLALSLLMLLSPILKPQIVRLFSRKK